MTSCSEDLARTICKWIKRDLEEVFVVPPSSSVPVVTTAARSVLRREMAPRSRVKTAA